uniref:Uncharacterized protein n=1 Tax=Utricularia reniformis TaxID=192314 RepID=A0A1Y0B415_9LAMI|nr:hypothetical protein AEK19_MT1977 [Utricularia reniformis]ART32140.1 hypothetical protein AEK19_MT1977 [Utricularia reniformis]
MVVGCSFLYATVSVSVPVLLSFSSSSMSSGVVRLSVSSIGVRCEGCSCFPCGLTTISLWFVLPVASVRCVIDTSSSGCCELLS